MLINIITLFPAMFPAVFGESIIKRAQAQRAVVINIVDLRAYGIGRHKVADDTPYGGGGGMVMKPEPIAAALDSLEDRGHVILTTPRGALFRQATALRLSALPAITLICGHYEGIDERVSELFVDEEISVGDYVLTGGEIPAMAIVDAVVRLIPSVLGMDTRLTGDSHYEGLLEHPQYTRPPKFSGLAVPEVLLSGDHDRIKRWRRKMALLKTRSARPDLFAKFDLSAEDLRILEEED
ncbi:MAG TPA: tRNA (guanosine(37)-N1)-methyltransferase TrmD [Deltaproteobacteria bacterium]|nr:tRNA (guanosine(37)-N1)-methyltransferase TrmD [Deltaproteobacteria bacterium]